MDRFEASNHALQKIEISLNTVVKIYDSLEQYVKDLRDRFDDFEQQASELSGCDIVYEHDSKRTRSRKKHKDEKDDEEVVRSGKDVMRTECFYVIIDSLITELNRRKQACIQVTAKFAFLLKLNQLEVEDVVKSADCLVSHYPNDLEPSLRDECMQLRNYIGQCNEFSLNALTLSSELASKKLISTFPNVDTALRMFLCTPVANCSGERSFSALKRVKNYLRATICQERLDGLSLLNIEHDLVNRIDYNDIIDDFAGLKARKRQL